MDKDSETQLAAMSKTPVFQPAISQISLTGSRHYLLSAQKAKYDLAWVMSKGYPRMINEFMRIGSEWIGGVADSKSKDILDNLLIGSHLEKGIDLGKAYLSSGVSHFHCDHYQVSEWLRGLLKRESNLKQPTLECDSLQLPAIGDYFYVGGPVSTPNIRAAWQFEGSTDRQLRRVTKPILPLRWFANPDECEAKHTGRVAWKLPMVGLHATHNWTLIDNQIPMEPCKLGEKVSVAGRDAYLPEENFIVVTKIRNLFDTPKLATANQKYDLPWLVTIEGIHGVGTRAITMLTRPCGRDALLEFQKKFQEKKMAGLEYQALFRVHNLKKMADDAHHFCEIDFVDLEPLNLNLDDYKNLHRTVILNKEVGVVDVE